MHPFEKSGLGKAPFRCVGCRENLFRLPDNTFKAGGTCDYCSTGIRYEYVIKSSDDKTFVVGCDCVAKTSASVDGFDKIKKEFTRQRREASRKQKREERQKAYQEQLEKTSKENFEKWISVEENSLYYTKMVMCDDHPFIESVLSGIRKWGSCTEKQFEAVKSYFERMTKEHEAKLNSVHIGTVGEKFEAEIKVVLVKELEPLQVAYNRYQNRYLVKIEDKAGNKITWFSSNKIEADENFKKASFTVKKHDEYKGISTTVVQRVKFI